MNRFSSSARRISMSQPRSSAITRSGFTFTPSIVCCRTASYFTGAAICSSPGNAYFGVVTQHEPVGRRFDGQPVNADVLPNQTVLDSRREIADAASLEHDAVLDLGVAHLGAAHD